jgi:5'-3' exonuclease
MSKNMNFILVDGSYYIFFRYHALLVWWKHAMSDSDVQEPTMSSEFIEKFQSTFASKLIEIPKKLKLTEPCVTIVGKDCPRATIWRNTHYPEYKGTRDKTNNVMASPFFVASYDSLFKNAGVDTILSYPTLEADDCIAITTKHILATYPDAHVWIIASDMDYVQLASERTTIVTLKYTDLTKSKHCTGDPAKDLFCKIVGGDKSDNIPAVLPRCGPKTAAKYYDDRDAFERKLDATPGARDIFQRNEKIISFEHIPSVLVDGFRRDCLRL